ncbi:MAG: glutathione S-transferase domain-containing protein, partial [Actinomycetota bacterium]|nr:glutathione S-transferase domain-containing protein [Actinomycetota bacterium]
RIASSESVVGGDPLMVLYVCAQKKVGPRVHPCARAARALDRTGHRYEMKVVGGYRLMPWTWGKRKEDRAEVRKLSGTDEVPILVLDDGEIISGSGAIAGWARANPAPA